jgi:ribulose-5-phosphate 4-epimerase/fuculose-1-phosphate aldolase
VSAHRNGIHLISQQSTFVLGSLAYHDHEGVASATSKSPACDSKGCQLFDVSNHGLLTVGKDIPTAFLAMYIVRKHLPHLRFLTRRREAS